MTNPSFEVADHCLEFIKRVLYSHKAVDRFDEIEPIQFQIFRSDNRSAINMVFVDEYVLGEATCYEVIEKYEGVQVIVNNGSWNQVAVHRGSFFRITDVLVFRIADFIGALHLTKMENYVPVEEREAVDAANPRSSRRK
jgi:hypothetical protein